MVLPLREGGEVAGCGGPESAGSSQCLLLIRRTGGEYHGKVTEGLSRCCGAGDQVLARPVLVESVVWCWSGSEGCGWWRIFT